MCDVRDYEAPGDGGFFVFVLVAKSATVVDSQESHMLVSVHAPDFLPYLGVWNRMIHADTFIVADTVRFKHRDYHNRNRIRVDDGWAWFTVPVRKRKGLSIREVRVQDYRDVMKAWAVVTFHYRDRAAYWDEYSRGIRDCLSNDTLFDVNYSLLQYVRDTLGIETPVVLASETCDFVSEDFMAFQVSACREIGGSALLSGAGNIGMLPRRFPDCGVDFVFQEFIHLPYTQIYPGWHPRLSVLDSLLTNGAEYTRELVERGWTPEEKKNGDFQVSEQHVERGNSQTSAGSDGR